MGALEDYINKIEKESGKWVAYWQLCTLESDYRREYGRYPSKSELREYGNSRVEGNFCTNSKHNDPTSFVSSSTVKNNTSKPSEEELKILKSLELDKEKPSDDSIPNVSFDKAYKIWKQTQ